MEGLNLFNITDIVNSEEACKISIEISEVITKYTFKDVGSCHAGICIALCSYCSSFNNHDGSRFDPTQILELINNSVEAILSYEIEKSIEKVEEEIKND